MVVEQQELINYLVSKEFAVIVDGKAILTSKFYEVFPPPSTTKIQYNLVPATPVDLVEHYKNPTAEEKKQIFNKFVEDAEIPHRVNAPGGGIYTVRHYSPSTVNKLISILRTKDLNYKRFCESTKHYYKTVAYKLTLQRYLCEEVWKGEYDEFEKSKSTITSTNDGSNRFET